MRSGGRSGPVAALRLALLLIAPALLGATPAGGELRVDVDRAGGGEIRIGAEALVPAPPAVLWGTLTDYDNLQRFVPDLRHSRVASAPGEPLVVDQDGVGRFLVLRFPIRVTFAIEVEGGNVIRFHRIAGNIREMAGSYRVDGEGTATRLHYEARLTPDFWVPPWIGPGILQAAVSRQLQGIIDEALRRAEYDGTNSLRR